MPTAKTAMAPRSIRTMSTLLTLAGLGAAFGVASCCALPVLFAMVGLSAAWLGAIAILAEPYRDLLLTVAAACLAGGGFLLWRQQQWAAFCGPYAGCASQRSQALNLIGLLIGFALLWAGYSYV